MTAGIVACAPWDCAHKAPARKASHSCALLGCPAAPGAYGEKGAAGALPLPDSVLEASVAVDLSGY